MAPGGARGHRRPGLGVLRGFPIYPGWLAGVLPGTYAEAVLGGAHNAEPDIDATASHNGGEWGCLLLHTGRMAGHTQVLMM